MAQTYTPGLIVTPNIRHRVRRTLPISGDVKVGVGAQVQAEDVVAETFLPGDVIPMNLANSMNILPSDLPECMLVQVGDLVEAGQLIARGKGFFGFFPAEYHSRFSGTVESVSHITGQLMLRGAAIPVQVRAFLTGEVTEVIPEEGVIIEAETSLIQGIFGVGGEAYGPLSMACENHETTLTPDVITPSMKGAIVVGGARMTGAAIQKAIECEVAALISGGMDDQDLREILGYDLGVAVTGSEHIGITLIITEGFGDIAMATRTFNLFKQNAGQSTAVNGATQIRAGVMRPEILIPHTHSETREAVASDKSVKAAAATLAVGVPVRIIREPYFGRLGSVSALPTELQVLESGSKARVLDVALSAEETVTVPRANIEIMAE